MHFLSIAALGALVGLVIGLTGEGSGSLLTPLLIILARMSPAEAVGTSLAFGVTTKIYGSWSFFKKGLVRMDLVKRLVIGGVPGALLGGFIIRYLGLHKPHILDVWMLRAIGTILILVSLLMLLKLVPHRLRPGVERPAFFAGRDFAGLLVAVGFLVGLTVSTTSIGSGALVVAALVILFPMRSGPLVGTSVFTGMVLIAVSSLPYAAMGNIDWQMVLPLVCGSIPAIHFASQLHGRLPRRVPESIIAIALMAMGVHIIWF
jgi:uncharacterized protein